MTPGPNGRQGESIGKLAARIKCGRNLEARYRADFCVAVAGALPIGLRYLGYLCPPPHELLGGVGNGQQEGGRTRKAAKCAATASR
jgi:hypothetical protein